MPKRITSPSAPVSPPGDNLVTWLQEQAAKLKDLEAKSNRLKLDFVENASEKGKVLLEVESRLPPSMSLKEWVVENTGIGYSTALLYMDVAKNLASVKDSNPLELTLRQVRDAIRDARQERGGGKPGSGKRKTVAATPSSLDAGEESDGDTGDDDAPDSDDDASDTRRWEREVSKAEAEAAQIDDGSQAESQRATYSVTVTVFAESDHAAVEQALSDWSPTTKYLGGSRNLRNLKVQAQPHQIGMLLQKLGKALAGNQPKKVRVSIEL